MTNEEDCFDISVLLFYDQIVSWIENRINNINNSYQFVAAVLELSMITNLPRYLLVCLSNHKGQLHKVSNQKPSIAHLQNGC